MADLVAASLLETLVETVVETLVETLVEMLVETALEAVLVDVFVAWFHESVACSLVADAKLLLHLADVAATKVNCLTF